MNVHCSMYFLVSYVVFTSEVSLTQMSQLGFRDFNFCGRREIDKKFIQLLNLLYFFFFLYMSYY